MMTAKTPGKGKPKTPQKPTTPAANGVGSRPKAIKAKPVEARRKVGKKSSFTPVPDATMAEILAEITGGCSANKAIRGREIPPARFYQTLDASAEWAERYARAKAAGMAVVADELLSLADEHPPLVMSGESGDPRVDPGWVQWQRGRVDVRKWLLSKLVPKKYGETFKQEITGSDGGPVEATITVPPGVDAAMEIVRAALARGRDGDATPTTTASSS